MITRLQNGSIPNPGILSPHELRQPEAIRQAQSALPEQKPISPLEGISDSAKANAYLYWPKDRSSSNASPSPMKKMRLWNQAIANLLTGNTKYDGPIPANLARAAQTQKGALAGMAIQYKGTKNAQAAGSSPEEGPSTGCKTCAGRKYKDGSNDSGVSFQTPTSVPSSTAALRVASHEGEHATRETARAQEEGSVITNKTVTFQYGCCPECNKIYVQGGTTSITKMSKGNDNAVAARMADMMSGPGESLNIGL